MQFKLIIILNILIVVAVVVVLLVFDLEDPFKIHKYNHHHAPETKLTFDCTIKKRREKMQTI